MRQAFEEIVSRAIDDLYQAALFLSGGEPKPAEDLLTRSVRASFRLHRTSQIDVDPEAWLQGRLVKDFVSSAAPVHLAALPDFALEAHAGGIDLRRLYRAAASAPPLARAVLWLVLMRRWSWDDVADHLGLDRAEVQELLQYRHALVAAVMADVDHRQRKTSAH